ncbi:MAG: NAD(P)H-hydrate epimerase [Planctomycetota bacterium]
MNEEMPLNDSEIRLTRQQARAVDRYAIEKLGIPGVVLMENAGINAAGAVFDVWREAFEFATEVEDAKIAIVCGGGNNGGDGYVVARQLKCWGMSPVVYAVPGALKGDAKVMANAWAACGGAVVELSDEAAVGAAAEAWSGAEVVVDALLGTGYGAEKGGLRGVIGAAVGAMSGLMEADSGFRGRSRFRGRVVALDVPSGMDADTGAVVGDGVRADVTVSFVAAKAGFAAAGAERWLGRVVTADIGLPWSAVGAAIAGMQNQANEAAGGGA